MTFTIKMNGRIIETNATKQTAQVEQIRQAIEFLENEPAAVSANTTAGFEVIRN